MLHSFLVQAYLICTNFKMENWHVAQRDPISNWEGKVWRSKVSKKINGEVPKLLLLFKEGVWILCHVQMHINQKGFTFYTISLFWESINNQVCLYFKSIIIISSNVHLIAYKVNSNHSKLQMYVNATQCWLLITDGLRLLSQENKLKNSFEHLVSADVKFFWQRSYIVDSCCCLMFYQILFRKKYILSFHILF